MADPVTTTAEAAAAAAASSLATTNPIELFTKTPYSLTEIVGWMLQAQLLAEVGPALFPRSRKAGVRNTLAFLGLGLTEVGRRPLAPLVPAPGAGAGAAPPDDAAVAAYVEAVARKLHVAHLRSWRELLARALVRTTAAADEPGPRHLRLVGMA